MQSISLQKLVLCGTSAYLYVGRPVVCRRGYLLRTPLAPFWSEDPCDITLSRLDFAPVHMKLVQNIDILRHQVWYLTMLALLIPNCNFPLILGARRVD